jgi:predicted Zn-dependent peptidase
VLHLEEHERPLVRALLFLRLDPGDVPPGRQGLPWLFHRVSEHAETADLKAGELDRILDDSGIRLTQAQGPAGFTWHLVARSRDQDRALGLLADRLLRTLLDPSFLETQQKACLRQLDSPGEAPRARLLQTLIQEPASRPTPGSLSAITLQDLLTFRSRVIRPDRAILILHGDLGLEQAKRMVLLSLGTWKAEPPPIAGNPTQGPVPALPIPAVDTPRNPSLDSVVQLQVVAPLPAELSPETTALLGLLLPGDARLQPVRVAMGPGYLGVTLAGEPGASGATLWSLGRERLAAFRQQGFQQADLDRAKAAWLGRRSLDSLHPEAQMDQLLAEALGHGVEEQRLKALSLETLNAGLRLWLDPDQFRIGTLGESGRPVIWPRP